MRLNIIDLNENTSIDVHAIPALGFSLNTQGNSNYVGSFSLPLPRTLTYQVTIDLPAGYKAEGLEALNNNVYNLTGSFVSTAKVDGQKLIINVAKTYKTDFVKKEDWLKMVEFLDAAYNFTQKKIVIKKGG
ncbi:MAG: hypothetical protein ABIO46_11040 [Chitinophagales bacterium]